MKFFSYLASAAAGLLLMTSCSSDEIIEQIAPEQDGNVSFTVQLPVDLTRTFGDGLKATTLSFAVYETGVTPIKPIIVSEDEYTFTNLQTTVNFRLANGKTYDIIFWADAPVTAPAVNPYTFNPNDQTITVNYNGVTTNAENRDAFFTAVKGLKITGPVNQTITLYRPFAQVNLGTDDLGESSIKDAYPDLKTDLRTTAYTTLNLLSGEVTNPTQITYALESIAPAGEVFPKGSQYTYLSMNYLLVDTNKEVVDCTFDFFNSNNQIYTLTVNNVPVQRNYRTNIYGSLLTSNANFIIEIEPTFNEPGYDQPIQ